MHFYRQANRVSSRHALEQLVQNSEEILVDEDTAKLYEEFTCSICISEFNAGDVVRKLICRHYFHHECIKLWIVRQQVCPNCKINPLTGVYNEPSVNQVELPWQVTQRAFAQAGF